LNSCSAFVPSLKQFRLQSHIFSTQEAKEALISLFEPSLDDILVCPISLEPISRKISFLGSPKESFECSSFGTKYVSNGVYLDLTSNQKSTKPFWERSLQEIVQTDTFRNPWVAFLYERGWRQGFKNAGFPGVDDEFDSLKAFFSASEGSKSILTGNVLDLSCGSGLMARRISKLGTTSRFIAADFSEVMLLETYRRFTGDPLLKIPELIRADVAQLPFKTESFDGIHAGAAMHCWPRLEQSLREVCRVLRPNGKFFATTFKKGAYGVPRQVNDKGGASFRFFEVDELNNLLTSSGFSSVDIEVVGAGCLIARCEK